MSDRSPDPGTASRHPALDAARTTAAVLAVIGAGIVAWRSARLVALVLVALVAAVPLRRAVARLAALGVPRGVAAGLVILTSVAGVGALAVVLVRPLATQVAQLVAAVPALLDALRRSERLAAFSRGIGGRDVLDRALDSLPALAQGALGSAATAATGVAGTLADVTTVLVTAMLFVAAHRSPLDIAVDLARPEARPRWRGVGARVEQAVSGYVAGLAAVVAARAIATTAFLAEISVPFYLALGCFAAATIVLPYLGAILRFVVLVPLAAASGGRNEAIATFVFLVAYDAIENYVVSPIIFRRAIALSPIVQFLAVIFLGYHLGAAGAVLALPLAAALQAVFTATHDERDANPGEAEPP